MAICPCNIQPVQSCDWTVCLDVLPTASVSTLVSIIKMEKPLARLFVCMYKLSKLFYPWLWASCADTCFKQEAIQPAGFLNWHTCITPDYVYTSFTSDLVPEKSVVVGKASRKTLLNHRVVYCMGMLPSLQILVHITYWLSPPWCSEFGGICALLYEDKRAI